jgi:hypothetical protein
MGKVLKLNTDFANTRVQHLPLAALSTLVNYCVFTGDNLYATGE